MKIKAGIHENSNRTLKKTMKVFVLNSTGCEWLGQKNSHVNYPWHKSEFLNQRLKQLHPYIEELDPWKPVCLF